MSGHLDRVMTVAAIQFQLARVELVAEGNRLLWLVTNIDNGWVDRGKKTGCQISSNTCSSQDQHHSELVDPSWKMEFLHDGYTFVLKSDQVTWLIADKKAF